MEVVVPVQSFHSDSATDAPIMRAPSSPMNFSIDPFELYCNYTTSTTSPIAAGETAIIDDNFTFDFNLHLEKSSVLWAPSSADELFEQGKIRPLNPPPRLSSSFASHQSASIIAKNSDATTMDIGRDRMISPALPPAISHPQRRRGPESLLPLRSDKGAHFQTPITSRPFLIAIISCSCSGGGSSGGRERSRKWRFKDFLLFRSSSEGRATGDRSKDLLQRFTRLPSSSSSSTLTSPKLKKERLVGNDSWSSSFRSVQSNGSTRPSSAQLTTSPHALHYEAKRAAAEETKKKTALPYRRSFFSCLRFTPTIHSLTTRGFADHFSNRGRP